MMEISADDHRSQTFIGRASQARKQINLILHLVV